MVFVAFIVNMLFIPSMTQAIFGGTAGMASNITQAIGVATSAVMMAGGI
jgi:type IV secretion system protein VirB6